MKRPSTGPGRPEPVEGRISLFARDLREKRDGSEVSFSRVAPVAHVLLVSLTIHEGRKNCLSKQPRNLSPIPKNTKAAGP